MIIFDDFDGYNPKAGPHCMACEAMLTDAVDGTLGEVDKLWFNQHITSCVVCAERYGNAQRGSAWLEVLKSTRPEPGGDMIARIMARTSDLVATAETASAEALLAKAAMPGSGPFLTPFGTIKVTGDAQTGRLMAFPRIVQPKAPWRMLLEPRFAMTAAMAFFSLALTMNLTGVRLNELHASDLNPANLSPANLERSYDAAHNRAVQYYDSLRVVHVMESKVDDLRQANEDRVQRNSVQRSAPLSPETQPDAKPKADPKTEPRDDKPGGSSRREPPGRPSSVVVADERVGGGSSVWTRNALLAAVWEFNFAGGRG